MKTKRTDDIELLLSKLDKKQLCEFIRKECAYGDELQQRFLALGAGSLFRPDATYYQSRVDAIIENHAGRHGYVEYRETFDLNRAICKILEEADVAMNNQRWKLALAILEGVSDAGEDIINCGDDSAGELGSIIEECFERWHELCEEEQLPPKIKSEIFDLSISNFTDEHLKGWDWWWQWIEMAITLADTSEERDCIIEVLDDVINSKGDEWSVEHNVQRAQQYKLEVMSKSGTPEEQRKFMYDNIGNPDFRRRLLQMAWDEGNHKEVLRLAKDGAMHDSRLPGLVNEWRKWELKTYRHMNDKTNTLTLAQYFFFEGGGFGEREYSMESMYALMKSLVLGKDWSNFVDTLSQEAIKKRNSVRELFIYTKEKRWDRYMKYLQNTASTYNLDGAPQEVWKLYKDELIPLYASCVREHFQYASNRNEYCDGVGLLRKLINYGGKVEADEIIAEQKARIPRRPALIDELSKLEEL